MAVGSWPLVVRWRRRRRVGCSGRMFQVRVIPARRRQDGRVVKGVNFVNLRDAGDPVEAAVITSTKRAPTSLPSSTSPQATRIATSCSTWCGAPPRPASCRSPSAAVCAPPKISARCCLPAPTGFSISTAAVARRGFVKAAQKFGDQCIVVAIDAKKVSAQSDRWEIFTHGGRHDRPRCHRLCPRSSRARRRAKSCSPRWTATARGRL